MKFVRHVSTGVVFFLLIFTNLSLSETKVVFTTVEGDGNCEIYLIEDIRSNKLKPINLTQHTADDWEPCWSPDGKKIAFTSDRTGDQEIYNMDIETRKVERVTYNLGYDGTPAWCPKGSIDNYDLYIMTLKGDMAKQLEIERANTDPDVFDPNFVYSVSPEGNSKTCTWGAIKR